QRRDRRGAEGPAGNPRHDRRHNLPRPRHRRWPRTPRRPRPPDPVGRSRHRTNQRVILVNLRVSAPPRQIVGLLLCAPLLAQLPAPPSRTDVPPVHPRWGATPAPGQGAPAEKTGFKPPLRGYDPEPDYDPPPRQSLGRRVSLAEPAASLILLKPTFA